MNVTASAGAVGRKADHSELLDIAIRVGLAAYGLVHLIIAWLALRLAFGSGGGNASSKGALTELAKSGVGRVSLYVVAAGFFALVVWQLIEAVLGHQDEEGGKRVVKRLTSGGRVLLYGALGLSALKVATGSGSSGGGNTHTMTAKVMSMPGGTVIVALVGVAVVAVAAVLAYRGWAEKFTDKLDVEGNSGGKGRAFVTFGKVGYISKGVALAIVGLLFIWAAWTHDPQKSGGLDQALHKVLQQPFGSPILVLVALGIGCYGLFCFAWAQHLKR
jgi:hypothetical protein